MQDTLEGVAMDHSLPLAKNVPDWICR